MILLDIPGALLILDGVALPAPGKDGLTMTPNKIWSKYTGRSAGQNAKMKGDISAIKWTIDITWPLLSETEVKKIKDIVSDPSKTFIPLKYYDPAEDRLIDLVVYTADTPFALSYITEEHAYYSNVTLQTVEQ